MAIKKLDEIPKTLTEKRQSCRKMLRNDMLEAINNNIEKFEFEGNYNYKYLTQYAREEAERIFRETIYYPAQVKVRSELKNKYTDRKYIFTRSEWEYRKRYIKITSVKREDRIHVYAQIDFDFGKNFYDILLADTDQHYNDLIEEG